MYSEALSYLESIFYPNSFLGILVSFTAGIVASLSPCIYPLIPVTLGIIGITASTSKLRGFKITFFFVFGIATTYTILGIIASLFGILLNRLFINPVIYVILTVIFLILGLINFGLIRLNFFLNFLGLKSQKIISIYIFGLFSAFALIPCNFPVLGAILSLIALRKNILYGALALFCFSLGHTFLLFIVGSFVSLINRLPKISFWYIMLKKGIGFILFAMSGYFFLRFISLFL